MLSAAIFQLAQSRFEGIVPGHPSIGRPHDRSTNRLDVANGGCAASHLLRNPLSNRQIGWIDVHTGLGPRGHGEKIYAGRRDEAEVARTLISELTQAGAYDAPIVTEVQPLASYWPAEDYHQDYFLNHPNQGYCAFVVGPKVQKFRGAFARWVKPRAGGCA